MKNSLSLRFNLTTGILVSVLLVVFGVYNQMQTRAALEDNLDKQVLAASQRLAQSLPATLWNFELDQMKKLVESEVSAEEIRGVFVLGKTKQLLGLWVNDDGDLVELSQAPEAILGSTEITLKFQDEDK